MTWKNLEDYLMILGPILTAAAGLNLSGIVPGLSGFVLAAVVAALAKSLVGLGQDSHISNWEDLVLFLGTFLGLLGSALTGDPRVVVYGTVTGLIGKSLPMLKNGFNIEDTLLLFGAVLTGVGAAFNHPSIMDIGILLSIAGKSFPSLGSDGSAGLARAKSSAQMPPPTPSPPPSPPTTQTPAAAYQPFHQRTIVPMFYHNTTHPAYPLVYYVDVGANAMVSTAVVSYRLCSG